jgi:hypothetical protein
MKRSQLMYALGAALSIVAMFALNRQQKPVFDTQYDAQEYVAPNGTLSFRRQGQNNEMSLMTTHVVTHDIARFGRAYKVRELLLRGAAPSSQVPGIELYVDVSRVGGDGDGVHDPRVLERTELPLLPAGRLGARPSFIMLDGVSARHVITGSLLLTEIVQMEAGDRPVYRAAGRFEMQVDNEHGIEMITGRLEGKISWDVTGA